MASCKECSSKDLCGFVFDKNAETNCDGFDYAEVDENNINTEDCAWAGKDPLMDLVNENTTLKIKAAGYDTIKTIFEEYMKEDYPFEEVFAQIDGVMRMEEAVTKALIK